jgi:taurine dioxygenase
MAQPRAQPRAEPTIEVRPIAGAIGAEIYGVDLGGELSEATIGAIRRAWLEHCVVFFRDQPLSPEQFLRFARRFGEIVEYPFIKGIEGFAEIIPVVKLEHEKTNFGGIWHSDTSYLEKPPMATMLIAREVPAKGGDTMFANTYLAYQTLSDGMKHLLDGLIAVNSSLKADASRTREDRLKEMKRDDAKTEYVGEHPVVRTHPETGRKALYVNVAHSVRFKDMTEAESAPLLNYLIQHQTRPEFTCRFHWEVGSIAFWDNRCAQHNPVNDYHGYRRTMHRITLAGDTPR